MTCVDETEPVPWTYCINKASNSTNTDVLYYLHARNGNATWWNDQEYHTGELYKVWRKQGLDAPTVVSISFGKLWVLSAYNKKIEGGLNSVFYKTVIPTVEKRLDGNIGERMIAGISMGGFNTLLAALRPNTVFTKAASICSPVPTVSHHDGVRRVLKSAKETGTSFKRAFLLWQFSYRYFPSKEIWQENDPLTLSKSFNPETGPAMYVTCGKTDDWGCFKGSELLVSTIENAGGDVQWVPREGGHCDVDYASLAAFLQPTSD